MYLALVNVWKNDGEKWQSGIEKKIQSGKKRNNSIGMDEIFSADGKSRLGIAVQKKKSFFYLQHRMENAKSNRLKSFFSSFC